VTLATPEQQRALEKIQASTSPTVIGIDEVGMGCWAGPVTVAGVVVPARWDAEGVKDSKALSPKQRKRAEETIKSQALSFAILSASNVEVDTEGVHHARERLTEQVALLLLEHFPDALIVQDGDIPVVIGGRPQNMVWMAKADALVPAVSAASILAKVCRDEFMVAQSKLYPGYAFERNMGYGVPSHVDGLRRYGPCPLHRRSYKPVKAFY
jgi:ribonuclease HII